MQISLSNDYMRWCLLFISISTFSYSAEFCFLFPGSDEELRRRFPPALCHLRIGKWIYRNHSTDATLNVQSEGVKWNWHFMALHYHRSSRNWTCFHTAGRMGVVIYGAHKLGGCFRHNTLCPLNNTSLIQHSIQGVYEGRKHKECDMLVLHSRGIVWKERRNKKEDQGRDIREEKEDNRASEPFHSQ